MKLHEQMAVTMATKRAHEQMAATMAAKLAKVILDVADEAEVQTMTGPEALRLLAKRLLK